VDQPAVPHSVCAPMSSNTSGWFPFGDNIRRIDVRPCGQRNPRTSRHGGLKARYPAWPDSIKRGQSFALADNPSSTSSSQRKHSPNTAASRGGGPSARFTAEDDGARHGHGLFGWAARAKLHHGLVFGSRTSSLHEMNVNLYYYSLDS